MQSSNASASTAKAHAKSNTPAKDCSENVFHKCSQMETHQSHLLGSRKWCTFERVGDEPQTKFASVLLVGFVRAPTLMEFVN